MKLLTREMMNNREFLQLAQIYDPSKHMVAGWYVSVKMDGQRAYWDGGITRGIKVSEIAWSNRAKDSRDHVSTGLWSRYGKVIHAPSWWLGTLPPIPLDGELYVKSGDRQMQRSFCSKLIPNDSEWEEVQLLVFDSPHDELVFQGGRINNPNFPNKIISDDLVDKVKEMRFKIGYESTIKRNFDNTFKYLDLHLDENGKGSAKLLNQIRLPFSTDKAVDKIYGLLDEVVSRGGEGLMLRDPSSFWVPKRSATLLKVKKCLDSEGVITGWTKGKGKLSGMMGALVLSWNNKIFELSGFTDEERRLSADKSWPVHFPKSSIVRFKYADLTREGYPNHARYWR